MMTDDRDDDDVEYWDALANRVATAAAREGTRNGVQWLAHSRAGWVLTSLLVAAVLAFLTLPDGQSSDDQVWSNVLAPTDDVGKTIALRDQPPALGALLFDPQARGLR